MCHYPKPLARVSKFVRTFTHTHDGSFFLYLKQIRLLVSHMRRAYADFCTYVNETQNYTEHIIFFVIPQQHLMAFGQKAKSLCANYLGTIKPTLCCVCPQPATICVIITLHIQQPLAEIKIYYPRKRINPFFLGFVLMYCIFSYYTNNNWLGTNLLKPRC